jgi:hypothetical protein
MIARLCTVLVVPLLAAHVLAAELARWDGPLLSFAHPRELTAASATDVNAEIAVTVSSTGLLSATVLASERRVTDADALQLADKWHSARVKNRAAWGMRANGGPPAETIRIGERRFQRFRDRIGSVLGPSEQTMVCGLISAHLVCVVVSAPQAERERADALAAQILDSVVIKKR